MTISATEGVTPGLFGPPASATASSNQADKDTFLQLLVAQLRYQDPMNPTDSGEFLAQSAQFTALEKMEEVAAQTAAMVQAQMAFGASNLVGRTVTYTDAQGESQTGTVSGVSFGAAGPMLDVGSSQVSLGAVQSVTDGTPPSSGSSGDDQPV